MEKAIIMNTNSWFSQIPSDIIHVLKHTNQFNFSHTFIYFHQKSISYSFKDKLRIEDGIPFNFNFSLLLNGVFYDSLLQFQFNIFANYQLAFKF